MSLTAEQTARACGHLAWVSERLAHIAGASGDTRLGSAAVLFEQHRHIWLRQLPESVLLEPGRRVVPASSAVEATLDRPGPPVATLQAVAPALIADLQELRASTGPVADAALARAIDGVVADLEHVAIRLGADGSAAAQPESSAEVIPAFVSIDD